MRLHLVDGTYELFRAHFSPRPGSHRAGRSGREGHGGARVARCSRCCTTPTEAVTPRRASPSTTPSARSATTSSPATRPTRACRPSCSRSSTWSRRRCARSGVTVWSMKELRGRRRAGHRRRALGRARSSRCGSSRRTRTSGSACAGERVVQVDRRQREGARRGRGARAARRRARRACRTCSRWWATTRTASRGCPASARRARRRCSAPTATWRPFPTTRPRLDGAPARRGQARGHPARAPRGRAALPQARHAGDGRAPGPSPSRTSPGRVCLASLSWRCATRWGSPR